MTISLTTGQDAAVAQTLLSAYEEAQRGMRRVMAIGLLAWEIKERRLKHGQWGHWLAAHCPALARQDTTTAAPKASTALTTYMDLVRRVLADLGYTVEQYLDQFGHFDSVRSGQFLLLPPADLPSKVVPLRDKICDLVDGKTPRQLLLDFKQLEDGRVKRGRLKGQGGVTRLQRAAAKLAREQGEVAALETEAAWVTQWLLASADDTHAGRLPDPAWLALLEALATFQDYSRHRVTLTVASPSAAR
jgi:hypothetical protein